MILCVLIENYALNSLEDGCSPVLAVVLCLPVKLPSVLSNYSASVLRKALLVSLLRFNCVKDLCIIHAEFLW